MKLDRLAALRFRCRKQLPIFLIRIRGNPFRILKDMLETHSTDLGDILYYYYYYYR